VCGICGIISNKAHDSNIVKKMNDALIHRGPDGEGLFKTAGLTLAMRRLSIIDIDTGWQPLYNEDKSLVLIINGEIYNYIELRNELIKRGHKFSTKGDGETIVHLYEDHGVECISYLRGMFSFALWDNNLKRMFIARDRMGEKPLYYYSDNNKLIFSSELHSLLSSKCIEDTLDPFSIDLFFHYHYIPEPFTPFKHVRKLPAGHYMLIEQERVKTKEICYWRMEDAVPVTGYPVEIIKEELNELSRMVIRADVPVGIALSGGIDSGMVAALAAKNYAGNMHAISLGYEGHPESDERSDARKVADYLGLQFHEVELTTHEFIRNFPEMCSLSDDPIADISAYGYYSISKAAKELNIPVMLQGQGGDELFWGYKWVRENYKYAKLKAELLNKNPFVLVWYYKTKFIEKINQCSIKELTKGLFSLGEAYRLYSKHKKEDPRIFPFYNYFKSFYRDNNVDNQFYGEYMLDGKAYFDALIPFKVDLPWLNPDIILTKLISTTYLLENGITQGDRLSMSNSVELRLPLLDYKFVEKVIGLRKNYPDINLAPKYWLKEAGKDLLPDWLFTRRKRGFEPPVQKWFSEILEKYGKFLPSGELVSSGILNRDSAVRMSKGSGEVSPVFPMYFNAIVLEMWYHGIKGQFK
jgi:asparagine synthase (glutamine-hydrolysing)